MARAKAISAPREITSKSTDGDDECRNESPGSQSADEGIVRSCSLKGREAIPSFKLASIATELIVLFDFMVYFDLMEYMQRVVPNGNNNGCFPVQAQQQVSPIASPRDDDGKG